MELMVSRRLWIGLIVGFALGFVLATLFVPWAGLLVQPTDSPMHSHMNSPAAARNGLDASYLTDEIREDDAIWACDFTDNGMKSAGRAFDNGFVVQTVHDDNGKGGDCGGEWTNTNAGGHDACNGHNPIQGCYRNSDHGT